MKCKGLKTIPLPNRCFENISGIGAIDRTKSRNAFICIFGNFDRCIYSWVQRVWFFGSCGYKFVVNFASCRSGTNCLFAGNSSKHFHASNGLEVNRLAKVEFACYRSSFRNTRRSIVFSGDSTGSCSLHYIRTCYTSLYFALEKFPASK